MSHTTVGKVAYDLLQKEQEQITIIDQQRAMQEDYMKNLLAAVDRGFLQFKDNFFIHVETKKEKLLENVYRNYFIPRKTCPTPNYDQTVFRYNNNKGEIEYIWTIPDRETCHHLKFNAMEVVPEEREILKFVLMFDNGDLFKLCKKLNNEKLETPQLDKKDLNFAVTQN